MNGFPTTSFRPRRGLRQGDPLSLFLFVICDKGLSALIRSANVGSWRGIKIGSSGLEITHILSADDSLLFMEGVMSIFMVASSVTISIIASILVAIRS